MSKIARIYQGLEEIQKYYQGGVLQRLFFDWKHYIGNELNIEYAKECAGRNVVIEGKTYQNLALLEDDLIRQYGSNSVVREISGNNSIAITTLSIGNATSGLAFLQEAYLFKASTQYTIECEVDFTSTTITKINIKEYPTYTTLGNLVAGRNKIKFTTSSDFIYLAIGYTSTTIGDVVKINNIKILEGDYTNIDIPDNIDGIESIGEREFVKSKNLINMNNLIHERYYNCNVQADNWGDSYNTNFSMTEYIPVKPNTTYFIRNCAWGGLFDKDKNCLKIQLPRDSSFTTPSNAYYLITSIHNGDKGQLEEGTVATPYEPFYEYYPVTIRNYNYKCETDNVVLPNGTKNSIDTIDGKKIHVQRVGNVLIDGTKTWKKKPDFSSESYMVCYFRPSEFLINAYRDNIISNYSYIVRSYPNSRKEVDTFTIEFLNGSYYNTGIYCGLKATSTDEFRNRLNENPINIYYQLEEPIYTYLESGIYDDITLPDGTKNEISYSNGKHIHIRKIDKVVFDGSGDEYWRIEKGNQFILKNSDSLQKDYYYKEIGTRFDKIIASVKPTSHSNLDNATGYGINYTYYFRLNLEEVDATKGATVDDLRAYLKENPITCYLEFSNYIETELYFSDITYKLNEPLRSLPNGVCDTIEEGKIVKRVEKVIVKTLDNLNVILQEANNNRIGIKFGNENNSSVRQPIISDNFFDLSSGTSNPSGGAFLGGGRLYLTLGLSTIDKYNKWFNNNPTIFYYELATPIETEITPDMILINGEPITDTVGIELPDGTKDSIENDYYVKRVGKVTYNGQEDWKLGTTSANIKVFYLINTDFKELSSMLCGSYKVQTTTLGDKSIYCSNSWRPQIRDDSCSTVDEFKQLLAENPVTVWYELATPVKIPLFSIKEGLTTLKSTNNITPQIELDCLVRDDFQNMCDNEWESGDIDLNTGVNKDRTDRIRLINYIKVKPNTSYKIDITNLVLGKNIGLRCYDISKTYISGGLIGDIKSSTYTFTTPEDCYYIRFIVETTDTNFKIYLKGSD